MHVVMIHNTNIWRHQEAGRLWTIVKTPTVSFMANNLAEQGQINKLYKNIKNK